MSDEAIEIILHRLQSGGQMIQKMLHEDRRERYFEALRAKKNDQLNTNVTAAFFSDVGHGAPAAPSSRFVNHSVNHLNYEG